MFVLFLICIPFFELYLFIKLGSQIGAFTTVMWVLLTMLLGWLILKFQGITTLSTSYNAFARGENPAATIANEFVMMLGAVLLIVPGFLTDFVGILCFIPFARQFLLTYLFSRIVGHRIFHFSGMHKPDNPKPDNTSDIIEGEYRRRQ